MTDIGVLSENLRNFREILGHPQKILGHPQNLIRNFRTPTKFLVNIGQILTTFKISGHITRKKG